MTSKDDFKQAPHNLLVIPGPIEVTDEVLFANAHPSVSHVSPGFVKVFGDSIRMTRDIVSSKDAQIFLISGSGTLGWDQISANLIEPGEEALVLHTGYFGDSFAECLKTYGAKAEQLKAEIGGVVPLPELEKALKAKKYKLVTFTHVDTSTGVLADAKAIADTVRRVSPETLIIMDGVCSVGCEEILFDEWGLDAIVTASQKGLATPPGLSIVFVSQRAMKVYETRKAPITSYYAGWNNWLPIMKAYESGNPAYFATPPVNLLNSYRESLLQIGKVPLAERFRLHREASRDIKTAATELGLKLVPTNLAHAANGMTAIYYPDGLTAADVLPRFSTRGIVVAGGLHHAIKDKYFRIGHMGVVATDRSRGDVERVINGLRESLAEARSQKL